MAKTISKVKPEKNTATAPKNPLKTAIKANPKTIKKNPAILKSMKKPKKTSQKLVKTGTLDSNSIDFCGIALKGRRHSFLLHYLTPGQPSFHNAKQAALKAGYTETTANVNAHQLLREPEIQRIVEANKKLAVQSLQDAAKRAVEIKKQRAFYDPADYFEQKEIEIKTKKGTITKTVTELKPLEEMTLEQRMCIDGLDVKGNASIPVYTMPNREKELNDIIKLDAELSKSVTDTSGEETREIIIERVTVRETKRA